MKLAEKKWEELEIETIHILDEYYFYESILGKKNVPDMFDTSGKALKDRWDQWSNMIKTLRNLNEEMESLESKIDALEGHGGNK